MAIPTVTSILTGAASILGDPSQEQFTTAILLPYYSIAFREAYDLAMRLGLQAAEREGYAVVAANTGVLIPSAVGITDMGEPIELWERGNITTKTITSVTDATPQVVTATSHGQSDGVQVEIYGVNGAIGVNQRWRIDVTTANAFALNGSVAGGAGTGGTMIIGGEESSNPFYRMNSVNDTPLGDVQDRLRQWKWMNDAFYFNTANTAVEVKIRYRSSGAAPQSGSVGWDNCQNFLQFRTASLIAPSYNMPQLAQDCKMESLGPSGQADGSGGMLRGFLYPMVREKQKRPARPQPFRARLNAWY